MKLDIEKSYTSDDELLLGLKNNNKDDEINLTKKYCMYSIRLAKEYYRNYKNSGISMEELASAAMEAFVLALRSYVDNSDCFYPYWKSIAINCINTYISENAYQYGAKMFAGLSLDTIIDSNGDTYILAESYGREDEYLGSSLAKEEFCNLAFSKECGLTKDEKRIFRLMLIGYNANAISEKTNYPITKVYNIIRRAREKISKTFNKMHF